MPLNPTHSTWNSGEGKRKSENKAFVLFIYLKLPNKKINSDLENFISFSVIYRFIGLRHEITEICPISQKHRSNWTVTLTHYWKSPNLFYCTLSHCGNPPRRGCDGRPRSKRKLKPSVFFVEHFSTKPKLK